MGNIQALNCCSNPNSKTMSADFRLENSTHPTDKLPRLSDDEPCNVQDIKVNLSSHYSSERVFLSHSGAQKNFVEQLCLDLTRANISCFFDKISLRKGREFPRRIFDAAQRCEVAVVVLSQDFISSRWPMQELCASVEAKRTTNPNLHIFPLYFEMTPEQLAQRIENIRGGVIPKDWKYITNSRKEPVNDTDCLSALRTLRQIYGLRYNGMEGEVAYRSQIVRDIRSLLPPSVKYEDPFVKGRERLCQEVANLFDREPSDTNGLRVAGLYGIEGSGKTTMCKSLCDFYSDKFKGLRAFHAEFQSLRLPIETLKRLVMILTDTDEAAVKFIDDYEAAVNMLKQRISSQRVFLALDNIPDTPKSVKVVKAFLTAGFGEGSLILLTARTGDVLERVVPLGTTCPFMHVPNLTEEEAMDVLLHQISLKACDLTAEQKFIATECADLCRFGREISYGQGNYHPLALTAFGIYLCKKFTCNLSHLLQIPDQFREYVNGNCIRENPFYIFERCFNTWDPRYLGIFLLLTFYAPHFELAENANVDYFGAVLKWLAEVSTTVDHQFMSVAISKLMDNNLIEGYGRDPISFCDLGTKLEGNKLNEMKEWMSLAGEGKIPILTRSIVQAVKFEDCKLIRRLNLTDCPNLRSITLRKNDSLTEVVGLNKLLALEELHIREMSNVEELPSFQELINLRHLTLFKMPNLKEQPDLSNCRHLKRENICISECKWQNECRSGV